jgi:hypothetical protein
MSTYKVIQDIEAEDKLLGPLTLRQFVYAAIVIILGFIAFKLAVAQWFLVIPFLPPILFFAMLAAPFGHDQSNEVWLLAKIRFFLKPRRRVWDQSGLKELVTITVPKKIERHLTNGLNQDEVRSRLSALANTIDSRGWAVKNVNVNLFNQPTYVMSPNSDRLVDPTSLPQEVPFYDVAAVDDILDENTNPTAQHLDQMITASSQAHREQLIQSMHQNSQPQPTDNQPADYWFMNQPDPGSVPEGSAMFDTPTAVTPGKVQPTQPALVDAAEEAVQLARLHAKQNAPDPTHGRMHTVQPLSAEQPATPPKKAAAAAQTPVPTPVKPAILELAHNDDLNVATLAREANKGEVVISLR